MKQGLPVTWPTRLGLRRASPSSRRAAWVLPLAWLCAWHAFLAEPLRALAQDRVLLIAAEVDEVAPDDAAATLASVLAELRERYPAIDLRAERARAPAEAFAACALARCRASWMLRRDAYAVVAVRFEGREQAAAPRARLDVYDANGVLAGETVEWTLTTGEAGSLRESVRAGVAHVALPAPSVAPLLITCDVPAARLWLDQRPLGVVPLGLTRVALGRHTLQVSAAGFEPYAVTVVVPSAGARVDVRMQPRGNP